MINKTSSIPFLQYGEVFTQDSNELFGIDKSHILDITSKSINFFYQSTDDVYFRAAQGIILLIVTKDIDSGIYEEFAMHRIVKLKKGIYYNFVAVSDDCKLEFTGKAGTYTSSHLPKVHYKYKRLEPGFRINEILSYYYSVRSGDYFFPGETLGYWELTFVDNGTLHTKINEKDYEINNYDIVLYGPGQFHDQMTTTNNTCSYLTVIFDMDIRHPELLIDKVFHADRDITKVINLFVKASRDDNPFSKDLMLCYLMEIIARLLQQDTKKEDKKNDTSSPMQKQFENELLDEIMLYIAENIYLPLSVEDLCYQFSISRSSLQSLFRTYLNVAPKQYISHLKLKKSKELIKENKYTISQISSMLGFTSIHYFSRKFKAYYGINPTDYAKTIYN
ncbi:MAG: helix-turn-helix transcriptional regulator [Holdemanella sp.]|nr:helix-turn-helix transcriptional regulator [Holdemanella sp.]